LALARTSTACPSNSSTPTGVRLRPASRMAVTVILLDRMSTVPASSCASPASTDGALTKPTCSASPSTAAATARQKSASSPRIRPFRSGAEKPGSWPNTPQRNSPRWRTASSVWAGAGAAPAAPINIRRPRRQRRMAGVPIEEGARHGVSNRRRRCGRQCRSRGVRQSGIPARACASACSRVCPAPEAVRRSWAGLPLTAWARAPQALGNSRVMRHWLRPTTASQARIACMLAARRSDWPLVKPKAVEGGSAV
jgi:hypothetical protein